MASSARTISGTCWPPWANWMWRMRSWRPWWRRPAAPSTSPFSWPCSARSWRVCWLRNLNSAHPVLLPFIIFSTSEARFSPHLFKTIHITCLIWFKGCFFNSLKLKLIDVLFLLGADPEDVIVSAFKVLDPEATGSIKKELWGLLLLFTGFLVLWAGTILCLDTTAHIYFPPLFSLYSLEELLTTQCDRFTAEEVSWQFFVSLGIHTVTANSCSGVVL